MVLIVMICLFLLNNFMKNLSQLELRISIFLMKQKSIVGWKKQLRKTVNQAGIIGIKIKEDKEYICLRESKISRRANLSNCCLGCYIIIFYHIRLSFRTE